MVLELVDSRIQELAKIVVEQSCKIGKKDYVQIVGQPESQAFVLELFEQCVKKGAFPSVKIILENQSFIYYKNAKPFQLKWFPKLAFDEMKQTKAIIYIQSDTNRKELARIPTSKINVRQKALKKIDEWRVNKTNWCIVAFPSSGFAQDAGMSLKEYEDFVYSATNYDFSRLLPKFKKLQKLEDRTNKVRIAGKGTDLEFSIKGRKALSDLDWFKNIPAGEVFNSVVEDSAEGKIYYEFPAVYLDGEVDGVELEFSKGKVVSAKAEKNQKFLEKILNSDRGAKFLGEFGIGLNYGIKEFSKDILFDEKIGGTIHLALGESYKECKGLNKSIVHWDMIKDLRKKGSIRFDGKIVEKNGVLKI